VVLNEPVKKWVNLFSGSLKGSFDRWVGRLGQYGPTIEHILKEEGVPADLIYLAMIESGFNLKATSHAAATGPWQFISSTGRMYGLCYDPFLDERRDVVKSTRAAARHLKDLHKIYADWYLAFAAYNAGPGKVNNAIKRSGSTNYWTLAAPRSRHLRQETKDYVPKVLAALHIVKHYRKFGYTEKSFGAPMEYDRVKIPDATDLGVIAKCSGVSAEEVRAMNPALLMGVTAPSREVEVFIPKGAKEDFQRRYAAVPAGERVSNLSYTVGRRETLNSVARKFGIAAAKLTKMNNLSSKTKLTPGQTLTVPATASALLAMASGGGSGFAGAGGSERAGGTKSIVYHKVKRGETLAAIARKYGASTAQLSKWNKMSARSRLRIGQKLKIHRAVPSTEDVGLAALPKTYQGKRMSGIAHIIALDEVEPSDIGEEDKIELPPMVAQSEDVRFPSGGEEPASVREEAGMTALPASSGVASSSDATPAASQYYTVKRRDSLVGIALKHRIKVAELKALNHLKNSRIQSGQRLIVAQELPVFKSDPIPESDTTSVNAPVATLTSQSPFLEEEAGGPGVTSAALMSSSADTNVPDLLVAPEPPVPAGPKVVFHRIKRGDTLWSVAQRYRVTVGDIKKWNGLKNDAVRPNQKLKIIAGTRVVTRKKYAAVSR
jgi:membrane-bound lytic murein transglycosylase D